MKVYRVSKELGLVCWLPVQHSSFIILPLRFTIYTIHTHTYAIYTNIYVCFHIYGICILMLLKYTYINSFSFCFLSPLRNIPWKESKYLLELSNNVGKQNSQIKKFWLLWEVYIVFFFFFSPRKCLGNRISSKFHPPNYWKIWQENLTTVHGQQFHSLPNCSLNNRAPLMFILQLRTLLKDSEVLGFKKAHIYCFHRNGYSCVMLLGMQVLVTFWRVF